MTFRRSPCPTARRASRPAFNSRWRSSITAGAGGLWIAVRARGPLEIVHLVNLIGVDDDLWRNAAPPPTPQTNVVLRNYDPRAAKLVGVFEASPEALVARPLEVRRVAMRAARGPR